MVNCKRWIKPSGGVSTGRFIQGLLHDMNPFCSFRTSPRLANPFHATMKHYYYATIGYAGYLMYKVTLYLLLSQQALQARNSL